MELELLQRINFKRRCVEESKLIVQVLSIWVGSGTIITMWINSIIFIYSGVRGICRHYLPAVLPRGEQPCPVMAASDSSIPLLYIHGSFDSTLVFCFAQTGYFFHYLLVLGITIAKYLVLKVKNDLSAA